MKTISNLSGGVNTKANPILLRDSECELIINYQLDQTGALTKRNGYTVYASQPNDSKNVLGLHQYTNTSTPAETTQVMVANNAGDTQAVIYYNNAGTWTASKSDDTAVATITNFNRARFATFLDYIFRVNGVNVVATSADVNGGTWGTTNAPGTITPSFVSVFKDKIYTARNGAAAGSRVYFSKLPSSGSLSWDITLDWFDVNPDDGDELTALENNGSKLLIFKNRALYRWDIGVIEPDRIIGVGTESQECVKTNFDLGITFFANSKGAYAYSNGRVKMISRKINKWIKAVPAGDWDACCAEIDDDHYYLYLSDSMTVDAKTYTNVMAVYTISLDAWVIYSLHAPWRFANKLIVSGAEGIYFGTSRGRTYQWDSGLTDNSGGTSENTATRIAGEIITKEFILTYPHKSKLNYIDVISENAIGTQTYYQLDRKGDWLPLEQLKERFITSRHFGKECRSARLRFTDTSPIASRLDGFNFDYEQAARK